jgi:hypothetical protein
MRCRLLVLVGLFCLCAGATIVDRIAVVVGGRLIKDSDIERDLRLTDFINGDPLSFVSAARRQSAQRLIDQRLIQQEIEMAGYPQGTPSQATELLNQIKKDRFGSEARYRAALASYSVDEEELVQRLAWQITVLNYIDQRFRAGVLASDDDLQQYYKAHADAYAREGAKTFDEAKDRVRETLTGERVNQAFEDWLKRTRERVKIAYHEEGLE